MKKIILTAIFIITIQIVKSQVDFHEGYYVNSDNDTIWGLVDYRGDLRNSQLCVYKADDQAEEKVFKPGEIPAYGFTDNKAYFSRYITPEDAPFDIKWYFFEYLVDGYMSLYYFRDEEGDHYYIEKDTTDFYELKIITRLTERSEFSDGIRRLIENKQYIGILQMLMADCPDMAAKINSAELTHKSLSEIVKKYNDCVCKECILFVKPEPWIKVKFAPMAGFGIVKSKLFISWMQVILEHELDYSKSYLFGLYADFVLARLNENFHFQLEAYYINYNFNSTWEQGLRTYNYDLKLSNLKFPLLLKYVLPTKAVCPYMYIGYNNGFMLNYDVNLDMSYQLGEDVITSSFNNYIHTDTYQRGYIGGIGIQFDFTQRNSLNVEYRYEYSEFAIHKNIIKSHFGIVSFTF